MHLYGRPASGLLRIDLHFRGVNATGTQLHPVRRLAPVLANEPGHITDFVASRDYALPLTTEGLTRYYTNLNSYPIEITAGPDGVKKLWLKPNTVHLTICIRLATSRRRVRCRLRGRRL